MFDPGLILPDASLTDYQPLDVLGFLEALDSPLLTVAGAAATLDQVAREVGLDPRVLLTKLQVEQSLVTQAPTLERLDWALGYGVPDMGPRQESYRGFERQLEAAARTLKGYLRPDHPLTVVGLVGRPLVVSDGVVVPRNRATAALYRYTPWIGDRAVESLTPPFGNYLFYRVWSEFFGAPSVDSGSWRLIVPPDRWRDPVPVPAEALAAFEEVARRLELPSTRDDANRKLYLGLPRGRKGPSEASSGPGGVTYPSGYRARLAPALSAQEAALYRPAGTGTPAPLVVAEPEAQLSPHFRMREFLPHDPAYRYVRLAPALVQLLEDLRHALGDRPLSVSSAYRPPAYNASVGGASQSVHMDGLAADVHVDGASFAQLSAAAERLVGDRGGVGLYPGQGFVHVDLRGTRARWP